MALRLVLAQRPLIHQLLHQRMVAGYAGQLPVAHQVAARIAGPDEIKKGDLIFFRTNRKSIINHVGMVTEVLPDEIKFIHSATSSGVIISSTKEPYYSKSFAQANRIYSTL